MPSAKKSAATAVKPKVVRKPVAKPKPAKKSGSRVETRNKEKSIRKGSGDASLARSVGHTAKKVKATSVKSKSRAPRPPPIDPRFVDIVTLADIKRHETQLNVIFGAKDKKCPAENYFDVDMKTGYFYHDQQGCGSWFLTKDGRVVDELDGVPRESVPVFLTKLAKERVKLLRELGL